MERNTDAHGTAPDGPATPTAGGGAAEPVGTAPTEAGGRISSRLVTYWRFARHLLEMVVAMMVGMGVFGLALAVVGEPPGYANLLVRYGLMGAFMAAPMVGWMRFRGHSWRPLPARRGRMGALGQAPERGVPGGTRHQMPEVEVVALTSVLEDAAVAGAIRAGAIGYLLKTTEAVELCEAIKAAAAGQVRLAPQAAARLMREVRTPQNPEALSEPLTERETEVLKLIARGLGNKQIAREMFVALSTIKTHVNNLYRKLGVNSRTQAALYAARVGLVPTEDLSEGPR